MTHSCSAFIISSYTIDLLTWILNLLLDHYCWENSIWVTNIESNSSNWMEQWTCDGYLSPCSWISPFEINLFTSSDFKGFICGCPPDVCPRVGASWKKWEMKFHSSKGFWSCSSRLLNNHVWFLLETEISIFVYDLVWLRLYEVIERGVENPMKEG